MDTNKSNTYPRYLQEAWGEAIDVLRQQGREVPRRFLLRAERSDEPGLDLWCREWAAFMAASHAAEAEILAAAAPKYFAADAKGERACYLAWLILSDIGLGPASLEVLADQMRTASRSSRKEVA